MGAEISSPNTSLLASLNDLVMAPRTAPIPPSDAEDAAAPIDDSAPRIDDGDASDG